MFAYTLYVYITYMCCSQKGQKGKLAPLELELETVVRSHVGAGNEAQEQLMLLAAKLSF